MQFGLYSKFWSGNPFIHTVEQISEHSFIPSASDVRIELSRLMNTANIHGVKTFILSLGHAQASLLEGQEEEILGPEFIPDIVFDHLPRTRKEYRRVVLGAGRCFKRLGQLAGRSESMHVTKRHIWSACFGRSLVHTLSLERVIRDHDVLILGETGTGKELVSQAILEGLPGGANGERAAGASINAAALPSTLIESELFGHVRGAFTGAHESREGRIRSAHGGSLFLDEVGDLPTTTQVKLLRVIETNIVQPVGSDESFTVDVRYVAATHKDLERMVREKSFRQDLYERLAGKVIRLPPLRQRTEDIVDIGHQFLSNLNLGEPMERERLRAMAWLKSREAHAYEWPGNVRELQNVLRNLILGLDAGLRSDEPKGSMEPAHSNSIPEQIARGRWPVDKLRGWYAQVALESHKGNLSAAARTLAVDRNTLKRWLRSV